MKFLSSLRQWRVGRHLGLLGEAPARAWLVAALIWIILAGLLAGMFISIGVQRQHNRFDREVVQLQHTLASRLQACELILFGLQDMASSAVRSGDPDMADVRMQRYASEAVRRYPFIYTMGFQPLLSHHERSGFESRYSQLRAPEFAIKDYQHDAGNDWRNRLAWVTAPHRERYIPWIMSEPAMSSQGQQVIGIDLLNDSVLGPSTTRALRSGEIESTPALRLMDNSGAIGYVQAVYRHDPPSDSPLLRDEEAIGVVTLYVHTDALLELGLGNRFDIRLNRQDADASQPDTSLQRASPENRAGFVERHVFPRFERKVQVDNPNFPYEMTVSRQLSFSCFDWRFFFISNLLAGLPSYLFLLLSAIRARARRHQEHANNDLYKTREQAMVTLHAVSDAVLSVDVNQIVRYVNPTATRLLGLPEDALLDQPLYTVFKLRYEFSRRAVADPFVECQLRQKVLELENNSYLIRPDGEKILIEGSVSPLVDRDGQLIGAVVTFRDTAPLRKRIQEALESSEMRLRQHENELARVARINSMGEMASGIAHEINQPLSAIMSYCQAGLALLEDDDPDLDMVARAVTSAVSQAERAGQIVHRLREFVSKKTRQYAPVDVNHAVSNALALAEHDLHAGQIYVEQDLSPSLPLIFADTIQLEQVVLNLIRNAMDAMQSKRPWGRLTIETRYRARSIRIRVSDNGNGFPEDTLDKIFDPFFSTKANGMGLGLTICQTIIDSFGGTLSAAPRQNGGAEFLIELPPLSTRTFAQQAGAEIS